MFFQMISLIGWIVCELFLDMLEKPTKSIKITFMPVTTFSREKEVYTIVSNFYKQVPNGISFISINLKITCSILCSSASVDNY